jgi:hypothetical protein
VRGDKKDMRLRKGQMVWVGQVSRQGRIVKVYTRGHVSSDQFVKVRFPAWEGVFYADQMKRVKGLTDSGK